jgi:hypothetical protein
VNDSAYRNFNILSHTNNKSRKGSCYKNLRAANEKKRRRKRSWSNGFFCPKVYNVMLLSLNTLYN